jgi:hypothetical protein
MAKTAAYKLVAAAYRALPAAQLEHVAGLFDKPVRA